MRFNFLQTTKSLFYTQVAAELLFSDCKIFLSQENNSKKDIIFRNERCYIFSTILPMIIHLAFDPVDLLVYD